MLFKIILLLRVVVVVARAVVTAKAVVAAVAVAVEGVVVEEVERVVVKDYPNPPLESCFKLLLGFREKALKGVKKFVKNLSVKYLKSIVPIGF